MAKDRRKKGCPNENCKLHNKVKQDIAANYCPNCGEKLIFICANNGCFNEIEERGQEHYYCDRCAGEKKDRKQKRKDTAKKYAMRAGGVVVTPVVVAGANIIKEVSKDGQKAAAKAGVEFVENAVKAVVKK
ncbi:hypothetical protein [Aminicella lysinilytica]|uniref:Uncharacterized protein n=1 Tax=Aminicella lysinilytica TaxID=433323 RepID=A0A4R6Q0S4_9FIRM|nr:hypothetical protein [Aminicella lysinilytica]TDP53706.1 hypothetical protein EV211_12321 [Aminicella lysinilytica]